MLCNTCDINDFTFFVLNADFCDLNSISLIFSKIEGRGRTVQVDETAICRVRLITNPSSINDYDLHIQHGL